MLLWGAAEDAPCALEDMFCAGELIVAIEPMLPRTADDWETGLDMLPPFGLDGLAEDTAKDIVMFDEEDIDAIEAFEVPFDIREDIAIELLLTPDPDPDPDPGELVDMGEEASSPG